MWQTICVIVIVAGALAFALWSFYRMATGKDTGCGACASNCASCPAGCCGDDPSAAKPARQTGEPPRNVADGGGEHV